MLSLLSRVSKIGAGEEGGHVLFPAWRNVPLYPVFSLSTTSFPFEYFQPPYAASKPQLSLDFSPPHRRTGDEADMIIVAPRKRQLRRQR